MPRKPLQSVRTTLYRVHGITNLEEAVSNKYLTREGFDAIPTSVNGRDALLVKGAMHKDQATWASRLTEISGISIDLGNSTAAALLLIQDGNNEAWALSYGMGFHLLDQARLDQGFGMRIALRTATPEYIQSITRTTLDTRVRTDRSSIPAGEALRVFGIGDFGELITRISATAIVNGLTVGDRDIRVRATDSLSLPLGKTPNTLTNDLDAISRALTLNPKPELQALDQLKRVKDKRKIEQLDTKLRMCLSNNIETNEGRLALGWPFEQFDEYGTPSSFMITGIRSTEIRDDIPTLDLLVDVVNTKNCNDPLSATKSVRVILFRDSEGDEPVSRAIPVINWLLYETELNGDRYCLFDSKWYAMDTDYAERLKKNVEEIFARNAPVRLPDWNITEHPKEFYYNTKVAFDIDGILQDRCLLRTEQNPKGFEACDIITPDGDLIHVKHVNRSTSASHLIAQAYVATQALLYDNEARKNLHEKIVEAGGNSNWLSNRPASVVLGIARKGGFTADSLFSFSQVTLARLDSWLRATGVKLSVIPINRV